MQATRRSNKTKQLCKSRGRREVFLGELVGLNLISMATGVESSSTAVVVEEEEATGVRGIAMDFPVSEVVSFLSSSESLSRTRRIPRRIRKRLMEGNSQQKSSSSTTVEDIEAKLRHAHIRRQVLLQNSLLLFQNYYWLPLIMEKIEYFE